MAQAGIGDALALVACARGIAKGAAEHARARKVTRAVREFHLATSGQHQILQRRVHLDAARIVLLVDEQRHGTADIALGRTLERIHKLVGQVAAVTVAAHGASLALNGNTQLVRHAGVQDIGLLAGSLHRGLGMELLVQQAKCHAKP